MHAGERRTWVVLRAPIGSVILEVCRAIVWDTLSLLRDTLFRFVESVLYSPGVRSVEPKQLRWWLAGGIRETSRDDHTEQENS